MALGDVSLVPGSVKIDATEKGVYTRFMIAIDEIGIVDGRLNCATNRFYWPEKYGEAFRASQKIEQATWAVLAKRKDVSTACREAKANTPSP